MDIKIFIFSASSFVIFTKFWFCKNLSFSSNLNLLYKIVHNILLLSCYFSGIYSCNCIFILIVDNLCVLLFPPWSDYLGVYKFCDFVLFWFWFFLISLFIFLKKFIFTLFYFTTLYWFCRTLTWIHHGCTCIPKHELVIFSQH